MQGRCAACALPACQVGVWNVAFLAVGVHHDKPPCFRVALVTDCDLCPPCTATHVAISCCVWFADPGPQSATASSSVFRFWLTLQRGCQPAQRVAVQPDDQRVTCSRWAHDMPGSCQPGQCPGAGVHSRLSLERHQPSSSQACLHVHRTFITETDKTASAILPTTIRPNF